MTRIFIVVSWRCPVVVLQEMYTLIRVTQIMTDLNGLPRLDLCDVARESNRDTLTGA